MWDAPAAVFDVESPLVSVIVRSIGRPTLKASIDSLAAQTYRAIEVVLVDAAGDDRRTLAIDAGPLKVRLVSRDIRLNRPAAANAGLSAASGAWISFLDDDDVFLPDHLRTLMSARASAPECRMIYSYGRSVFSDGTEDRIIGQPYAPAELFERNYISLSTSVFSRELVDLGCRFDESLELLEDWDFALQMARHTRFHFSPTTTFVWYADEGTSGAGGGANYDETRYVDFRQRVRAKWLTPRREAARAVERCLQEAEQSLQRQDFASAESRCRTALQLSENHPFALSCLARVRQAMGDLDVAVATQELAVAVRPFDARIVHNLALLLAASGNLTRAAACAERSVRLAPDLAAARALRDRIHDALRRNAPQ